MNKGKFIVFEGCEGSGKSTQLSRLSEWLDTQGVKVYCTREPGGTELGKQIRKFILDSDHKIAPMTELLLYLADRSEHIATLKKSLDLGYWVLCDRFSWSTLAYQGYGRGQSVPAISYLNNVACQVLTPDWTVLLDIDPVIGLARKHRQGEMNKFEKENIEFHRRVREGYLKIFEETLLDGKTKETLIYCQSKMNQYREVDEDTVFNTIINSFPFDIE
jgi:dTMP kinase